MPLLYAMGGVMVLGIILLVAPPIIDFVVEHLHVEKQKKILNLKAKEEPS